MASSSSASKLSGSITNFGLKLLQHDQLKEKDNAVISPFSISVALSMVLAGAKNVSREQMIKVMNLESFADDAVLHASFQEMIELFPEGQILSTANRLYMAKEFKVAEQFLKILHDNYRSKLALVDFGKDPEKVRQEINAWVEKNTNEKIKDLIAEGVLDSMTCLVLVNALYFKRNWLEQFLPDRTEKRDFHVDASTVIQVDMMSQNKVFAYTCSETFNCKMIELMYENRNLSMLILLPNEADGLEALEQKLDKSSLLALVDSLNDHRVQLSMPKFRVEGDMSLSSILCDLGMTDIFSQNADLSGMFTGPGKLCVSEAIHKTFLEANEKGTEAAAATAMRIVGMSLRICPEAEMTIDHPFFFLIRERNSGSILFMGRVSNPNSG